MIDWLLQGDPAIRWQTLRDLCGAASREIARARAEVASRGWGQRLLALQDPQTGLWGGGIYTPKWTSTTYTMLLLRDMGLPAQNPQALQACRLLLDEGVYADGGINYWGSWSKASEACVTGMVLSICARFECRGERLDTLARFLLDHQMPDGGWNCRLFRGATHASFHTTISVLEGLRDYEKLGRSLSAPARAAQARGREFLLLHRLFRSHRTGQVVKPAMTRFTFPPRWHYDVLRGLDYFRECGAPGDPRLDDGIALVEKRRRPDGAWLLPGRYPGRDHFLMEQPGEPSRWNTLRALRVLQWWNGVRAPGAGRRSA